MAVRVETQRERRFVDEAETIKNKTFQEILDVSRRRGEVWLFPMQPVTKNYLPIGIWGNRFGQFLFEAQSQKYVKKLEQERLKVTEGREDMVIKGKRVTIEEVQKRLVDFIRTYYPEFENLGICFVEDTKILFRPKFQGPTLYAASRTIE